MSVRPIPQATVETAPFWAAARAAELHLPRCGDCQQLHYPPLARCPHCYATRLRWTKLTGLCRLRSWTTVHMASVPGVEPPFTICEVEIAEQPGLVLVAHLAGVAAAELVMDQPMKVGFSKSSNDSAYPQVEPV